MIADTRTVRAGVIVPSVNAVFEDDVRRFVSPGLGVHVARWRTSKSHEDSARALATLPDAARELADVAPEIVAFACTAGSAVGGPSTERRIVSAIEDIVQVPVVTTAGCLTEQVRAAGARAVLFCCPFDAQYADAEVQGFRDLGLPITAVSVWGLSTPRECVGTTPADIVERVAEAAGDHVDAVIISCANVRAMETIAQLQLRLGRPVFSSNHAVLTALAARSGVASLISAASWPQSGVEEMA